MRFGACKFPAMGICRYYLQFLIRISDWTALHNPLGFWSVNKFIGVRGISYHQYLDPEFTDKSESGGDITLHPISIDKIKELNLAITLLLEYCLSRLIILSRLYFLIFLLCIYYFYIFSPELGIWIHTLCPSSAMNELDIFNGHRIIQVLFLSGL